jgi:hypothetical protein
MKTTMTKYLLLSLLAIACDYTTPSEAEVIAGCADGCQPGYLCDVGQCRISCYGDAECRATGEACQYMDPTSKLAYPDWQGGVCYPPE